MSEILWGDIIFQLVFLIILVVIIALIVSGIRTLSKRSKQMDRIENKLDVMKTEKKG